LVEELLKSGVETASDTIIRSVMNSEFKNKSYLKEFRDCFAQLVNAHYFIRAPTPTSETPVPTLQIQSNVFEMQDLNLNELNKLYDSGKETATDSDIYWMVNLDRFHQDFRDEIMIKAIERQIDTNASECFQFILQIMYQKTDPWIPVSNPVSLIEIKQLCEKKSNNMDLVKYVDQYVHVIENDPTNFLKKMDESGGGLYVIHMKNAFEQLAWSTIENIITQRFGSKATRIFRVVRERKFIEQEEIQKEAMVPAKEAKLYTYKLLEENFLQIQTIKKAGGPAKAFYLFHVNQYRVRLK
jgi:DNA-directed RNA polymerase III subunit RPC3